VTLVAPAQSKSNAAAFSAYIDITFDTTPTVGSQIIVCVGVNGSPTWPSGCTVTDNQGNTYTNDVAKVGATGIQSGIWSAPADTASGTFIVTVAVTPTNDIAALILEEAGTTATPIDATQSGSAADANPDTGATATLAQADELVVAMFYMNASTFPTTITPDSYTKIADVQVPARQRGITVAYNLPYATTAQQETWTISGHLNPSWAATIATYKGTGPWSDVTGTATATIVEADIKTVGSKTIIITLTGDTWIAS